MKPAYLKIADDVLRRIRAGEWQEGNQLPTIDALEAHYPQSRMTLYRAMRYLAEQGFLTMTRGRGTFVKTVHRRQRVAILTRAEFKRNDYQPFAFNVFRYAHAFFTRCGLDAQFYCEDDLTSTGLPTGLTDELDRRHLTAMLTIAARCPNNYCQTSAWQSHAVPYVNIGAIGGRHRVYVDRESFVSQAMSFCRAMDRRRVALFEREEHFVDHLEFFQTCCAEHRLEVVIPPPPPLASCPYEEYGFELLHRYWSLPERPDALIVPDDVIAKGASQAALALGLTVPRDILIVALTNQGARFFYPVPVVPIEVDLEQLTAVAGRILLDQINGADLPPCTVLVEPKLVRTPAAEWFGPADESQRR